MNARQIRSTFTGYRGARTAVLLAFGLACVPALASSSLTPCEENARQALSLDVPAIELSVQNVDLGSAKSATAGNQHLEQPIENSEWTSPSVTLTPRAQSIVRRMFEEPPFSPPSPLDPLPAQTGKSAPVAEAIAPQASGDQVQQQEDVDTRIESEELNGISTHLPGVTSDDLVRFKRRMYRTDI